MKTAIATLKSASPYSPSRQHFTPKLERELNDAYEQRTWREKGHYDPDGHLLIPPMMFKNAIAAAAQYMGMQVPGKGKSTYTKHFEAGVIIPDAITLTQTRENVESITLSQNADGKRGSGTRVMRIFPIVNEWKGQLKILVLDDILTEDVVREHLIRTGQFIGIGRWRPRQGGMNGRFEVEKFTWKDGL